jgi:uncharacterized protein (DUF1778 family)
MIMLTRTPSDAQSKRRASAKPNRPARRKRPPVEKPVRRKPAGAKRRSSRIEARITPENLAVIKRAAEIQGRSVSDFIATAAQEVAHRTIEETHIIRLSVEQHEQFMEAIRNPPPLAPAMKRAIERHRLLIGEP